MFTLIVVVVPAAIALYWLRHGRAAARGGERNPFAGTYALLLACVAVLLLYLTFTTERKAHTVASDEHPSVVIKAVRSKWEESR
ncbi:MAG TPA: hypothetical protein VMF57_01620 [Solirubrobacteraceae bacterium]|nr:hypothetical protein [Solirubrobacteraceae bacterium]